ncbi:MAG: hypothetical protein ACYTFD_04720 [Planctomycetota bacterium]|jgi:hypothetical protein
MRVLDHRLVGALLLCGLLALITFLVDSPPAQAGPDEERGWTVWQSGARSVYRFKDRWTGSPTQSGFTVRNSATGVEVHYYGTFRVEHRARRR